MKFVIAVVLCVCLSCGVVNAVTITFDSLSGSNRDPYLGSTEGNFSVTPTSGDWYEAHLHGNPVPSIFGNSYVGVVDLTENTTGLFTFTSVELSHAYSSGPGTYSIEGFLDDVSVLLTTGTMPLYFVAIASPNPNQVLDTLTITMYKGSASYNIDNIVLVTVPEPATLLLLGLGVVMLRRIADDRQRRTDDG